jgi:hypothetical protein
MSRAGLITSYSTVLSKMSNGKKVHTNSRSRWETSKQNNIKGKNHVEEIIM